MLERVKDQEHILKKLGIEKLNAMQEETHKAIRANDEVVLLSPTGTGKTLAFLLPIISALDPECKEIQALIIVPSRELALQIEQVTREMGSGYKVNAIYGGRSGSKDRMDLNHKPAILIGTPGRLADRIRRDSFSTEDIKTLVLDEFDKSLEIGFESEMEEILQTLTGLQKKIMTSATQVAEIPAFVGMKSPLEINYLGIESSQLKIKSVASPSKDKLDTLVDLLGEVGDQPGIVFCNFKDTIDEVSTTLVDNGIVHGCFHGGMEQKDRERALIKFRNGTYQILLATDLAARGLDIPELKFIIHYQLPSREHEFTHRNGRTARMKSDGTAYVLHWKGDPLPDFINGAELFEIDPSTRPATPNWKTLFISGGRKDKISKGDIAGLFFKQGQLTKDQLGVIELKTDCAFVGVASKQAKQLVSQLNNTRLKKKKVRVTLI